MTAEMVRMFASGRGSRYQARIRDPNTAMPAASARKYVTNVICNCSIGTMPAAQSDNVPTMPPTSAATRHEPTRKNHGIARVLERMPRAAKLPQQRDRYRRFQHCCNAAAGVGEDEPRQRYLRLRQQRETV